MEDYRQKFQELLRRLFQFESADLDFGIYRIMNYRRDVIEKFIEKDLLSAITAELNQGALAEQKETESKIQDIAAEIKEKLAEDAINGDENLKPQYVNTKLGQEYGKWKEIRASYGKHAAHEPEIFNHLYTFFSRYYDNGDFMSKRRYSKKEKYAIPYNGEEVYLHWANSDQYYIKTGEYFTDFTFRSGDIAVHFKLQAAQVEKENIKGDKRFFIPLIKQASYSADVKQVVIPFEYRPLTEKETISYGQKNQQGVIITEALEKIPKHFKSEALVIDALMAERRRTSDGRAVSYLEHHLYQYTSRNSSDFFIHKDLKGFLTRELDFYIKNEVMNLDELEASGEPRIEGWFQMMRVIRTIGHKIIAFVASIEELQMKLFEKKKFVIDTQYCITMQNISEDFYPEIAANDAQWAEWKEQLHIDEEQPDLFTTGKSKKERRLAFLKSHPTLMLDTKYFDRNFVGELLAVFDNLDGMTDGLLIHSENYQALNLLQERYREKVKCIYIDPPYNANTSEILYKNSYKHSSWLSLMQNRLEASKMLLRAEDGIQVIAIDEVEQEVLGRLLAKEFPSSEKTCIIVIHNATGQQGNNFSSTHEYAYFIYPLSGTYIGLENRFDNPDIRPLRNVSIGSHLRTDAANCFYPIYVKKGEIVGFGDVSPDDFHPGNINIVRRDGIIEVYPIGTEGEERKWVFARQSVESIRDELNAEYDPKKKIWDIIRKKQRFNYKTVWTGPRYSANSYGSRILNDIFGANVFTYPKSIFTVMDSIDASLMNKNSGLVLDYFAGSGTTGHAIINLNRNDGGQRKFTLVEMGDYFDTVLLPRIKKVTFTPEWKDGKPKRKATAEEARRSPRIVKYLKLEGYEDVLNNISFQDTASQRAMQFDDYVINYMIGEETKGSDTLLNIDKLASPFNYKLTLLQDGQSRVIPVDLMETFNYLIGMLVKNRAAYYDEKRQYVVYRGTLDSRTIVVVWRDIKDWTKDDFERDRKFVEKQSITEGTDEIFVNGDSVIPNARSLDPVFKSRMLAPIAAGNGGF